MKHKSLFIIPLAVGLMLAACNNDNQPASSGTTPEASSSIPAPSSSIPANPVTGISITEGESATLRKGDTLALHATVTPADADDTTVTWSSANPSIAFVDNTGVVTARTSGTVKITAATAVESVKAEIEITVIETTIALSGDASVKIGGQIQLTATVQNAIGQVAWDSSNKSVATVDATGKVSALAEGKTTITATVDGVVASKEITVTVPKLDGSKLGVPSSYKMSVTHEYQREVAHTGEIKDPISFHPSADHANGVFIEEKNIPSSGLYYRFSITTAGVYRFYSYSTGDTKVDYLYKYDEEGNRSSNMYTGFTNNDTYGDSQFQDASNYCGNPDDFYTEVELSEGDYVVMVREFGTKRADMVFHIELVGDTPVYPEGPSDLEDVTDVYELYRVDGYAYYSKVADAGVILENNKAYSFAFNQKENEYIAKNEELTGFDFATTALSKMADDGVATFVELKDGVEKYEISVADGFGATIAGLLGVGEIADKFVIYADAAEGSIVDAKIVLKDGVVCTVVLEPTSAANFPVVVNKYAIGDDGEYTGEGGANQDW